ncbi:MAG: hypothetical protein WD512_08160, partial [Candidatus Paceibacterota bacterium]
SSSLGTIQLAGDLSGSATAPVIKVYPTNMIADLSGYSILGQQISDGKTALVPVSYGTFNVGIFTFGPNTLTTGQDSISIKASVGSYMAYGIGSIIRTSKVIDIMRLSDSATITTFYQNLVTLAVTPIAGCAENESEEWKIYLHNSANDCYFMHLHYFKNINIYSPIFGKLYAIKKF